MLHLSSRVSWLVTCVLAVLAGRVTAAETAALTNLSVRTTLEANQTLSVGGVVNGSKDILVRAGGPVLNQFGLTGMTDPRLALYTSGSTPVATNDDWSGALAATFRSVGEHERPIAVDIPM